MNSDFENNYGYLFSSRVNNFTIYFLYLYNIIESLISASRKKKKKEKKKKIFFSSEKEITTIYLLMPASTKETKKSKVSSKV